MTTRGAGSPAFRCETCHVVPKWTVVRVGDVAVSWACEVHLSEVCDGLQRDWEETELVVKCYVEQAPQ